jgi:hypothetical protein
MKELKPTIRTSRTLLVILCIAILMMPAIAQASPPQQQGPWWQVTPEEEVPSEHYDSILYSEIAPKLREIEQNSNRVQVEVMGQSAGGRNLFLVTLSAPEALGRLGRYQALRQQMIKDPVKAQEMIDQFDDFKVPVFINGSIHGDEYPGVDAGIRLIETLAYEDSEEVRQILDNVILLVNVVQNPDGRVLGTRRNSKGFDLNRDFITLSQPETRATVRVLREWNPMVMLDLHGFVNPMLIEPCTPPHNPNYEYDLYIQWAFAQAQAMEAELFAQTGLEAQIPFRDDPYGWDDWPPIFAPMYAMYHGAYGHTLETPSRSEVGVDAHYAAVWGALEFVSENRLDMIRDQIEIFRRGFLDIPQVAIPEDILSQTPYNQYNDLTTIDFPAAYIIPKDAPLQESPSEAARLVDHLIFNDVQLDQASQSFSYDGVTYPASTYIVWMDQPKRGLANTILWAGWDISENPGLTMYDISGWSHPLLWGVTRVAMEEDMPLHTHPIGQADSLAGFVEGGKATAYAYLPTSNVAIQATNDLLAQGVMVLRSEDPFEDSGRSYGAGTFILPGDQPGARPLANSLANQYGLEVFVLADVPMGSVALRLPRIALDTDEGVRFALDELGFDWDLVDDDDINAGALDQYDVYINDYWWWDDLDSAGQASFTAFLANGGDYIGIGRNGIRFADGASLLDFDYDSDSRRYNGVIMMDTVPDDPVAAQYPADSYGFVYRPTWFTVVGPDVHVSAAVDGGDYFVSGYWPGWETVGAAGQPIVVHGANGPAEITLMGINPTFRAHPEGTYRMVANALYNGLD